MFRDARVEIGGALEGKDPFINVKWPKVKREPPNLLTAEKKSELWKRS